VNGGRRDLELHTRVDARESGVACLHAADGAALDRAVEQDRQPMDGRPAERYRHLREGCRGSVIGCCAWFAVLSRGSAATIRDAERPDNQTLGLREALSPDHPGRLSRATYAVQPWRPTQTSLRLATGPVTINGRRYVTSTYDGTFPGPALVICPGDRVTVHLINDLGEDTNLHVHGLHVSPSANHDNIFVDVRPGQRFTYQYRWPQTRTLGRSGTTRTAICMCGPRSTTGWPERSWSRGVWTTCCPASRSG